MLPRLTNLQITAGNLALKIIGNVQYAGKMIGNDEIINRFGCALIVARISKIILIGNEYAAD